MEASENTTGVENFSWATTNPYAVMCFLCQFCIPRSFASARSGGAKEEQTGRRQGRKGERRGEREREGEKGLRMG